MAVHINTFEVEVDCLSVAFILMNCKSFLKHQDWVEILFRFVLDSSHGSQENDVGAVTLRVFANSPIEACPSFPTIAYCTSSILMTLTNELVQ